MSVPCRPRICFTPTETLLGILEPSATVERDLVVETYAAEGEEPPDLGDLRANHPSVVVATLGSNIGRVGEQIVHRQTRLRLRVETSSEIGIFHRELTATCSGTSPGSVVEAKHGIVWNVRSNYRISPPQVVVVRDPTASATIVRQVTIARLDDQPLNLTGAQSQHSAIRCQLLEPESSGSERKLNVIINQNELPQSLWTELELQATDPAESVLKVPVVVVRAGRE